MCQAYPGEAGGIRTTERFQTIKGFKAAMEGQPKSSNPNFMGYAREAWNNGWECWKSLVVPHALERKYLGKTDNDHDGFKKLSDEFRETGELPAELKDCL